MLLIALIIQLAAASTNSELKIEKLYVQSETLSYRDYQVSRTYDSKTEKSWAIVKRNGRVLAKHNAGEGLAEKEATHFGISSLLGKNTKQLIIEQNSGGAHCCNSWWIYDLYPEFRLVFRGDDYPIGDDWGASSVIDIDRNGVFELVFSSNWFAYFGGLVFSESPLPKVIFRYNKITGKYYPAGKRYSAYLLKGIGEEIKEINNDIHNALHPLAPILDVMLRYIYAGEEKLAWPIFEQYYMLKDKKSTRHEIKQRLNTDKIYQSIYGCRNRV
jgi:hypothetical protein